jgi:hypothetical protein
LILLIFIRVQSVFNPWLKILNSIAITMKAHPEIEGVIEHDTAWLFRWLQPNASRAGPLPAPGVWIEGLALGSERPEELRGRLDAAYAAYAPKLPTEFALVDQATLAQLEIERCHRSRAALRAVKVRTALRDFQWAQENYVEELHLMFDGNPRGAIYGLKRSAAGVRFLVERWERLGRQLEQDQTWYGADRIEAIQLQGLSAMVDDLYMSEQAYWTWVWCLAAQPNPKQRDIDLVLHRRNMPKRLQDMDHPVWRPDPDESRARLRALVAEILPPLRELEVQLRSQYEEPARAEAVERALARVDKDEQQLLRELRSHERSLAQAHKALATRWR